MALDKPLVARQLADTYLGDNVPAGGLLSEMLHTFLRRWSQQAGDGDLDVLPFTAAQAAATSGHLLFTGSRNVYGVMCWKVSGNSDDTYLHVYNAITDATANARVILPVLDARESAAAWFPGGLHFGTGVTVASQTTAHGAVSDAASDSPHGFVIVGA